MVNIFRLSKKSTDMNFVTFWNCCSAQRDKLNLCFVDQLPQFFLLLLIELISFYIGATDYSLFFFTFDLIKIGKINNGVTMFDFQSKKILKW